MKVLVDSTNPDKREIEFIFKPLNDYDYTSRLSLLFILYSTIMRTEDKLKEIIMDDLHAANKEHGEEIFQIMLEAVQTLEKECTISENVKHN